MALINLLKTAALVTPIWLILVVVYRLTLHPLAKYPGPLLWRISAWPDAVAAKSGRRYRVHHQLHCKYGRVVRIGPNRLSWDTAEAFHDIHTKRNANVIKSGFVEYTRKLNAEAPHILQLIDKREHAQRRKIISHAFSDAALKSSESLMLKQICTWLETLSHGCGSSADGWSVTKDLGHWTNLLTIDIFGELCFGEDFGASKQGDNDIITFLLKNTGLSHTLAFNPFGNFLVPLLRNQALLKLLSSHLHTARWALRNRLHSLVASRQAAEIDAELTGSEPRKDIFHYVLKGRDDDGSRLELQQYIAESVLLIIAGTDTTSTALSAALHYLARHPSKLSKLRHEIDNAFPSASDIHTGNSLSTLPYLRACIDEAMRMNPPVPGALTRLVLPNGHTIHDSSIPGGIEVEVPLYSLHRNPAYFPLPHCFLPERWIPGSKLPDGSLVTDELLATQRHAFVPFSTGPRNCIGMRMANMEMTIVLARMVWLLDMRFDAACAPRPDQEFETEDWFVSAKKGPYLQFKSRQRTVDMTD